MKLLEFSISYIFLISKKLHLKLVSQGNDIENFNKHKIKKSDNVRVFSNIGSYKNNNVNGFNIFEAWN